MKLDDLSIALAQMGLHGSRVTSAPLQDDSAGLAWRREMERAQSGSWFPGVLPAGKDGAPAADQQGGPASSGGRSASSRSAEARPFTVAGPEETRTAPSARNANTERHELNEPSAPESRSPTGTATRTDAAPSAVVVASSNQLTVAAGCSAPAEPGPPFVGGPMALAGELQPEITPQATGLGQRASAAQRAIIESRLPVRVHVEGDAVRSTVWLGIDSAAVAQLPALTQAVGRWLLSAGYGAPTWICNGQPLTSNDEVVEHRSRHQSGESAARSPRTSKPFVIDQPTGESA